MVVIEIKLPSRKVAVGLVAGVLGASILIASLAEATRYLMKIQQRRQRDLVAGKKKPQVYRVVLTGGPCSGKTSSLNYVKEVCQKAGYVTLVVPEVPTILIDGGAHYPGLEGGYRLIEFEIALLRLQLQMEDSFICIGRSLNTPTIILCDRGALDISAYLMPRDWLSTITAVGLTNADISSRYDSVVHLVTAADGAESFYTLTNNTARTESPKDARVLDKRVRAAWQSHPQFTVIDNHTDFQGKLQRTADSILKNAGAYFGVPYSSSASSSLSNGSNDKLAPPPSSSSAVEVDGHGPQVALS